MAHTSVGDKRRRRHHRRLLHQGRLHHLQIKHGNFQTALLPRKAPLLRACPNAEDLIAQSIPGANPITSMFLRYYDLAHAHSTSSRPLNSTWSRNICSTSPC